MASHHIKSLPSEGRSGIQWKHWRGNGSKQCGTITGEWRETGVPLADWKFLAFNSQYLITFFQIWTHLVWLWDREFSVKYLATPTWVVHLLCVCFTVASTLDFLQRWIRAFSNRGPCWVAFCKSKMLTYFIILHMQKAFWARTYCNIAQKKVVIGPGIPWEYQFLSLLKPDFGFL